MAKQRALICPYCGKMQAETEQCRSCSGFLDPLSRQATHNAMGPWFIKEEGRGFHPGCSYETMVKLIERGDITRHTIVRGPTTRQFWTIAKRVPCLSHLLGFCHACDASVDAGDHGCHACGVKFGAYLDRNYMGLPEVRPLPWEAEVEGDDVSQVGPRIDVPEEMRRDWRARGGHVEGGRLSSFATDDELTGSGEFAHVSSGGGSSMTAAEAGGGAAVPGGSIETADATSQTQPGAVAASKQTAEAQPQAAPATTFDTGIATRSLQRRLRENARTIQRLWIALIVSVIANGMLLIGWQAGWFNMAGSETDPQETEIVEDQSAASSAASPASTTPSATGDAAQPTVETDDAQTPAPNPPMQNSDGIDAGNPAVVYADDEDARSDEEAIDAASEMQQTIAEVLEQVESLVKSAKDEQRPLEERIKQYEKAILLLKPIAEQHAEVAGELKIAERIADYEREAERLRLRVFFP